MHNEIEFGILEETGKKYHLKCEKWIHSSNNCFLNHPFSLFIYNQTIIVFKLYPHQHKTTPNLNPNPYYFHGSYNKKSLFHIFSRYSKTGHNFRTFDAYRIHFIYSHRKEIFFLGLIDRRFVLNAGKLRFPRCLASRRPAFVAWMAGCLFQSDQLPSVWAGEQTWGSRSSALHLAGLTS